MTPNALATHYPRLPDEDERTYTRRVLRAEAERLNAYMVKGGIVRNEAVGKIALVFPPIDA